MPLQTLDATEARRQSLVSLTPTAIKEMKRILGKQDDPGMAVRLGVSGGGCAGLNYEMKLDKPLTEDKDRVFEFDGVQIVVDRKSLLYLAGLTVDFSENLLSGGFQFNNPNATRSCGCGTSFSV
jgi:iron-sulfur cluster assembly protein